MDGKKADIFGAAAAKGDDAPKAKRHQLKKCDTVAAKGLDPWGKSVVHDMSLRMLWDITQKGDKWALYHSNLAAGPERELASMSFQSAINVFNLRIV